MMPYLTNFAVLGKITLRLCNPLRNGAKLVRFKVWVIILRMWIILFLTTERDKGVNCLTCYENNVWKILCFLLFVDVQVKWSVFLSYARALGFIMSFLLLASYLLFEASSMFSNIWLSEWTEDKDLQNMSLVNSTHYKNKMDLYLGVYGGFGLLQCELVLLHRLPWPWTSDE